MKILTLLVFLFLASCFPFSDPGADEATREQVVDFLDKCQIDGARIEAGEGEGETEWVIAIGTQPQEKWDCLDLQMQQAGAIATTWGHHTEKQ